MGAYSKQGTVNNYIDKIFVKESAGNIEIAEGYVKNSSGFSLIYKNIKTFSITYNLVGCEINSEYYPVEIVEGTEETIQVDVLDGYSMAGVTPSVTGATVVSWEEPYLIISNPTDNVVVTINAIESVTTYSVTFSSDYEFSIDGSKIGTLYQTSYEYTASDPPDLMSYEISMDYGIDDVVIQGSYTTYGLSGNYGDTNRTLTIWAPRKSLYITITGVV